MFVSYDEQSIVKATSTTAVKLTGCTTIDVPSIKETDKIVGKKLLFGRPRQGADLRIAVICNFDDQCGIATYTSLLLDALRPKVQEIKIFAEHLKSPFPDQAERDNRNNVVRCWRRGESMVEAIRQVQDWKPDMIHIQHEFGIFPKAGPFLKMLEMLDGIPYVVTLHSVYEHLDKTICTAYIKNMIVHSDAARESLYRHGHLNDVDVIYHGCVEYPDTSELWNIFQNDYTVIQFGFGFNYKNVEGAIDAIAHLKDTQDKFKDIFYCYLCSENPHTRSIQQEYYGHLNKRVEELGLQENVVILRGFLSEKHITNFLRTAKLAIFPYRSDPTNMVYGASGAIRNALACGVPTIASECHHFDDLEGVVPRPATSEELAAEIDKVFSDGRYRQDLVERETRFVKTHNWDKTSDQHIEVFQKIIGESTKDAVLIN